jgi:hypothetical protein
MGQLLMQQSAVFFEDDRDDWLQGRLAVFLLQPLSELREQLFALGGSLLSAMVEDPHSTGSDASSSAYTRMQIDSM